MEFEDILQEVGGYGRFQKEFMLSFVIPMTITQPWFWLNLIFMVNTPDHWCNVPELSNSNLSISEQRTLLSSPDSPSCTMYDRNYTMLMQSGNMSLSGDLITSVPCKSGWQYDNKNWDSTITTKWNLVCEDGHYTNFILFWQIVGSFFGNPIFGAVSDKFGRRITIFLVNLLMIGTEFASLFVDNFIIFVIIRCINGAVLPINFVLPLVLTSEMVSPEKRIHVNGIMSSCWTIGSALLPVIAYFCRSWTTLVIVNCVAGLCIMCYWKYVPESPSWLVLQGRYEEAKDVMMRIAEKNEKTPAPASILAKLKELGERNRSRKEDDGKKNKTSILKYPYLRRNFFILLFCWAANNIAYLGLTYNAVNLNGNEYLNFIVLALVEIPGCLTFWLIMDRLGRRWTATFGFFLTSLSCFLPIFDFPHVDIVSTMLGKYIIYGIMMVTDQQSSEIYPTVIRSFGMSVGKSVGAGVSILVPYLAFLSVYGKWIPFVVIGCTCIIATVMTSFLPETLNENLPQTITDAEEFGKNQKFFSWIRRKNMGSDEEISQEDEARKRY